MRRPRDINPRVTTDVASHLLHRAALLSGMRYVLESRIPMRCFETFWLKKAGSYQSCEKY